MGKRREYSDETKAAVMAALLAGQSISSVAEQYSIPKGTVKGWKSKAENTVMEEIPPEQREEIGELLMAYLRSTLRTLTEQSEFFRDRAWLASQSADQLAVLHGVTADKAIRILEALARGEE